MFLAESDNYRGKALERLQIWKQIFSNRLVPFSLSDDLETRKFKVAGEELAFSHVLFKPNVFVSTHILRTYEKGSVLKNLLGLGPDIKKARVHKKLDTLSARVARARTHNKPFWVIIRAFQFPTIDAQNIFPQMPFKSSSVTIADAGMPTSQFPYSSLAPSLLFHQAFLTFQNH